MSTLHKDHRDVLIAPVVSEKSYGLLDANKYTFLVRPDANKTEIKIAVEKVFDVKVTVGQHPQPSGQDAPYRTGWGKRKDTKRAIVSLAAGRPHRHLRGSGLLTGSLRRGLKTHGNPQVQADHPGPSWLVGRRLRRDHADDAGEVAGASAAQEGRPQQPGPDHHAVTRVAATSAPTASSTSVATTRTACRPRSRTSSTTPTAPRASRCCTTRTARSATSSLRRV